METNVETETEIENTSAGVVDEEAQAAAFDEEAGGESSPAGTKTGDQAGGQGVGETGAAEGEGGDKAGAAGENKGTGGEPDPLDDYLKERAERKRQEEIDAIIRERQALPAGEPKAPETKAEGKPGEKPQPSPPAEESPSDGEFSLSDRLNELKEDPILSKVKFTVDEESEPLTFEQMLSEYPAITELSAAMAEAISRQNAKRLGGAKEEDIDARIHGVLQAEREAEQKSAMLFETLGEKFGHADAREISEDDAFWGWVEKQRPQVQELANSDDPADADMILKRYKSENGISETAGGSNSETPGRARARQEASRQRDLHSGGVRTRARQVATQPGGGQDFTDRELKAAFDEEAEKQ